MVLSKKDKKRLAEKYADVERVAIENLPSAWFIGLPDHPRQRDTNLQKRRALQKHMRQAFVRHEEVAVALYKNKWYKVNGHTRVAVWLEGHLPTPTTLSVTKYVCHTAAGFERLYKSFDNRHAAETPRHLAFGRLRQIGLKEVSSVLASQASQASKILLQMQAGGVQGGDDDHIENMVQWKDAFEHFNKMALAGLRRRTNAALTAAELFTFRRDGAEKSDAFWDKYHATSGSMIEGEWDAVAALARAYEIRRKGGASVGGTRGSGTNCWQIFAVALQYYNGYHRGQWYKKVPSSVRDIQKTFDQVQNVLGRLDLTRGDPDTLIPLRASRNAEVITEMPWDDEDWDDWDEDA